MRIRTSGAVNEVGAKNNIIFKYKIPADALGAVLILLNLQ